MNRNIDHFNLVVLKLLTYLYDRFPKKIELNIVDIAKFGSSAVPPETSDEDRESIEGMVNDVISFLGEEGFIKYKIMGTLTSQTYVDLRLSMKGITILGSVPESLTSANKAPLITRARESIVSITTAASIGTATDIVKLIFKQALGLNE